MKKVRSDKSLDFCFMMDNSLQCRFWLLRLIPDRGKLNVWAWEVDYGGVCYTQHMIKGNGCPYRASPLFVVNGGSLLDFIAEYNP